MHDIRILSIRQPWAWLIVEGYKPVENRTWATAHRGPVLIHASMKFDWDARAWLAKNFGHIHVLMPKMPSYEYGGIIGAANLTDVVTEMDSRWFTGPQGFIMEQPKPLPFFACKGMLGLTKPVGETLDYVNNLIEKGLLP